MNGFIYIWHDRKHNRFYVGYHWGDEDDGYVCSSSWMKQAYLRRPEDFRRRILFRSDDKKALRAEELRIIDMMKSEELGKRYYNVCNPRLLGEANRNQRRPLTPEKLIERGANISAAKLAKRPAITIDQVRELAEQKKRLPEICEILGTHDDHVREVIREAGFRSLKQLWPKPVEKPRGKRGESLKQKWADPAWAENQRRRLSEGAKNRPPRSEESKMRASRAQLGKPKPRRASAWFPGSPLPA